MAWSRILVCNKKAADRRVFLPFILPDCANWYAKSDDVFLFGMIYSVVGRDRDGWRLLALAQSYLPYKE
jgi:hypothetical protein